MHEESGFTLMELMTVIGVIAIIAAIAVPNVFGWLPKYRLKGAVNQIWHVIQLTKLRAIRENSTAVLQFKTANNSYFAFVDNGGGDLSKAGNGKLDSGERVFRRGRMPVGIDLYRARFAGRSSRIQFDDRGFPGRFIGHVYLRNGHADYLGLKLGIAGNARITRSYDEGENWQ